MRVIFCLGFLVFSATAFAFIGSGAQFPVNPWGPQIPMGPWGRPQFYPSFYGYPYGPMPSNFYGSPSNYWPMMSPWNVPACPMCGIRGIAEENKSEPEKK